jgi:hypothetical protein
MKKPIKKSAEKHCLACRGLSPCEAAGETGAADICGSLCEMRR